MKQRKSNAKSAGLRLLTIKDRSIQELRERLARDFTDEEVEETIEYLLGMGYLNDHRYAQSHVDYRNRNRPTGNYLLRIELDRKGIDSEIIDQVLNSSEKEYDLAFSLAQQRIGTLGKVDALARMRRLYGLLQRRGFPAVTARQVVGELLDRDPENEYN